MDLKIREAMRLAETTSGTEGVFARFSGGRAKRLPAKTQVATGQSPSARLFTLFMASILAALLAQSLLVPTYTAFAETDDIDAELSDAQRLIEETAAAYDEAVERVAQLEAQIAENEERIEEIEAELPDQRKRSAKAVGELYKLQKEGISLLGIVLESSSLSEFLKNYHYLSRIYERTISEIKGLESMYAELEERRESLEVAFAQAEQERVVAAEALAAAQEAREQAQREAEEQAAAEEAARQEAAAAAEQQESSAEASATESEASESTSTVTAPSSDNADWSTDKASFVAEWASRIDAYLAGSPLAGYGEAFAVAAWDYGVDPRFSPAISTVESSKGASCYRPYNAWGWGGISWSSWEEAIDAHVRGLARGYGYTLTEEGAQRYCPSNWQHWYNRVAEEMNKI